MRIDLILIRQHIIREVCVYSPTTRLLTVLEVLQNRESISGRELADMLEVDVRSVRRYVTMLRDMGIPVDSEAGRYGAYQLRPGFRLPPMMFTEAEILAITLGLLAVSHMGLASAPGVLSASAKIERVLPDEMRKRLHAVHHTLSLNMPVPLSVDSAILTCFIVAAYERRRLEIAYRSPGREPTERDIDVYGVVYHAGNWYAVAYCHLREDRRMFRVDRVQSARLMDISFKPPRNFDVLQYALDSMAGIFDNYQVEVLLKTRLDEAQRHIPRTQALLEAVPEGVIMRMYTNSLMWAAQTLASLGVDFVVKQPPELRDALRELAARITRLADAEE